MGAEALLTIFNDAWFGRSMAPYQHEAIAIWRAIENRRYFVRVGNAGVSGVIDPVRPRRRAARHVHRRDAARRDPAAALADDLHALRRRVRLERSRGGGDLAAGRLADAAAPRP